MPCRNGSNFQWEDGSAQPALIPSGQDYAGSGYSHWGITSAYDAEPNNAGNTNEQCVSALGNPFSAFQQYHYFNGSTTADKNSSSNYVRTYSDLDVYAWNDDGCSSPLPYICELTGA